MSPASRHPGSMSDRWLSGKVQIAWFAPELDAQRCVHSRLEIASCQACVDACPYDAWQLTDEALQIDVAECDACGLCEPVCPEQAIRFDYEFKPRLLTDQRIVFVSCEKAEFAGEEESIPCLHAISERSLLEIRNKGEYQLVVASGDCDKCERGGVIPLSARLDNVNRWLESQGMEAVEAARCRDGDQWKRFLGNTHVADESDLVGRRGFFRQMLGEAAKTASRITEKQEVVPPGLVIKADHPNHITPAAPVIDPRHCIACDACIRICPHQALTLDGEDQAYKIHADSCTGCGLCVDVCEDNAVTLHFWETPPQSSVPLLGAKCASCGVDFRVVDIDDQAAPDKCRICQQSDFSSQLFQVYE